MRMQPSPVGMSLSIRADHRYSAERWVTAAAIESLCEMGFAPTALHPEMPIAPGSRPDLVVITGTQVSIFESKRRRPGGQERRQVIRYADDARARWPELELRAFLIWPRDEWAYPYTEADIEVEQVV